VVEIVIVLECFMVEQPEGKRVTFAYLTSLQVLGASQKFSSLPPFLQLCHCFQI
jgi:hypothetical protein